MGGQTAVQLNELEPEGHRGSDQRSSQFWQLRVILGLALLCEFGASAAPVDAKRVFAVAAGWLQTCPKPLDAVESRRVLNVDTFLNLRGTPLFFIVSLSPAGFILMPADDTLEPVFCFAAEGRFNSDPENPLLVLVTQDLTRRLNKVANTSPSQFVANSKWALLEKAAESGPPAGRHLSNIAEVWVAPLIQTKWDQQTAEGVNACYNYYTPPYADGMSSNYPCGCVATAMAQVLRYWQWPDTAVGTPSFPVTVLMATGYVNQVRSLRGGDGAGGVYSWTDMILTPSFGSTLAQRQAIGALCADVSVALGMVFRATGSGAWMSGDAYKSPFAFGNAIRYWTGDNFTTLTASQLLATVNPNLDAGCPVMLAIDPLGHAVACDGYGYNLSTLYHHLNFGWSGNFNAWYTLPDSGDDFTWVPELVYNIWPHGAGEIISGRVLSREGNPLSGATVTAVRSGGGSYTATSNARGIYALAQIPAASDYTLSVSKNAFSFTNQVVSTGLSSSNSPDSGNRWAVNLVANEGLLAAPPSLVALPLSRYQVALTWSPNAFGDAVLLAWNTNATFGVPAGSCPAGTSLPGGGFVLCNGNPTNVVQTNLLAATPYYYQAWSVRFGTNYSPAIQTTVTTLGCAPPTNLQALASNSSCLKLSWKPNSSNDLVLVAWNISPVFGEPQVACAAGDLIAGGGTVLYSGGATNVVHENLAAQTRYYYQVWSVRGGSNYSTAVSVSAATSARTMPFAEFFENATPFFNTWSQQFISGTVGWGLSAIRHNGTNSAMLYSPANVKTRLVTPRLDFGTGAKNAQLSFWHFMNLYGTNQDTLSVFYKTNANASYQLLAELTNRVAAWTQQSLLLPNPNSTYYLAFEGNARGGYGIFIDDLTITSDYPLPASFSAWAQVRCPGSTASSAFLLDRDGDGVPNGFEYAFGTNWTPGTPLLLMRLVSGLPTVEIPTPMPEATVYVRIAVERSADLLGGVWQTNGIHPIGSNAKPANRDWLQLDAPDPNAVFRLHGLLLE